MPLAMIGQSKKWTSIMTWIALESTAWHASDDAAIDTSFLFNNWKHLFALCLLMCNWWFSVEYSLSLRLDHGNNTLWLRAESSRAVKYFLEFHTHWLSKKTMFLSWVVKKYSPGLNPDCSTTQIINPKINLKIRIPSRRAGSHSSARARDHDRDLRPLSETWKS